MRRKRKYEDDQEVEIDLVADALAQLPSPSQETTTAPPTYRLKETTKDINSSVICKLTRERETAYTSESMLNAGDLINETAKRMEINALNMIALHFRRRLHQYIRFRYARNYKETKKLVDSCYRVRSKPELDGDGNPTGKTTKKYVAEHPNTKGARLYTLLPVATSFQAAYIKLNGSTVDGLFARIIHIPEVEDFLTNELDIVPTKKKTLVEHRAFAKPTFQKNRAEILRKDSTCNSSKRATASSPTK
ncbi:hypothetical protein PC121_g5752 [Phytophthora cactorum]|nr:hypothetical protein PC121_g5752 [Phytophthora cactorum]